MALTRCPVNRQTARCSGHPHPPAGPAHTPALPSRAPRSPAETAELFPTQELLRGLEMSARMWPTRTEAGHHGQDTAWGTVLSNPLHVLLHRNTHIFPVVLKAATPPRNVERSQRPPLLQDSFRKEARPPPAWAWSGHPGSVPTLGESCPPVPRLGCGRGRSREESPRPGLLLVLGPLFKECALPFTSICHSSTVTEGECLSWLMGGEHVSLGWWDSVCARAPSRWQSGVKWLKRRKSFL